MTDLVGQTLGQYRIVEQIGQGGMATVYKAYQPGLERYVALKVLAPFHARQPGFSQRFQREAKAIANLNHPNILPVHDFGQTGEYSFIAMRYIPGARTLKEVMAVPLTLERAADLVGQVAAALDHAHRQGVIHRDVKPGNVLMDGDWALLTDFGVARMTEASTKLTDTGVGIGTPAYMSPEQGQGKAVDQRTDIYSLGIILFEMLTGHIPHDAETPVSIIFKRATEPLPLPRNLNPNIPEAVQGVILKALARDPEKRFASAGTLAAALREAMGEAGLAVWKAVPTLKMAETTPVSAGTVIPPSPHVERAPAPPPPGVVPAPARSLPWIWMAVLGAVVVLVGGLFIALAGRGGPAPTPAAAPGAAASLLTATATPTRLPAPTAAPAITPVAAASPTAAPTSGLGAAGPRAMACPPAVGFEETITCSLDAAAEVDSYSFEARANDVAVVRVLNTSGSEWLTTSLWGPQKSKVCAYTGSAPNPANQGCTLPADGSYTLQVERADARQTQSIPYTLYLYRRNHPLNALPISFAQNLSGALDTALEIDTYTFEARANDTVVVKVLNTSGSAWLTSSLWDSQNSRVCSYTGSAPNPADLGCTLPGDGTYIIQVEKTDARQAQPIPYALYVHRRNDPLNALPINFDQSLSGALDTALEVDTYTFEARADDTVLVKVLNTSGSEWLTTSLWGTQKSRICSYTGSAPNPADRGCTLPGDGTYTLQVEKTDARQAQPIPYTLGLYRR